MAQRINEIPFETSPPDALRLDDLLGCDALREAIETGEWPADEWPEDLHGRPLKRRAA